MCFSWYLVVWYVNFMSEHLRCIQLIRNQLTWLYRGYQLWEPVKSWSSCLLFMAQSRNTGYWMSFRPLTNTMMYTSSSFRKSSQQGCKPIFLEALNNNCFWKKYWMIGYKLCICITLTCTVNACGIFLLSRIYICEFDKLKNNFLLKISKLNFPKSNLHTLSVNNWFFKFFISTQNDCLRSIERSNFCLFHCTKTVIFLHFIFVVDLNKLIQTIIMIIEKRNNTVFDGKKERKLN